MPPSDTSQILLCEGIVVCKHLYCSIAFYIRMQLPSIRAPLGGHITKLKGVWKFHFTCIHAYLMDGLLHSNCERAERAS